MTDHAENLCPRCGYDLTGHDHLACPECGLGIGSDTFKQLRLRQERCWLRLLIPAIALVVILYTPHLWLFFDHSDSSYHWSWIRMFFGLPGMIPTLLMRQFLFAFPNDTVEVTVMHACTLTMLVGGAWLASRNRWLLLVVLLLLLVYSIWSGVVTHAIYRW